MEQTDDLRKLYKLAVIAAAAIILTLAIYTVVVEVIRSRHEFFFGFVNLDNIGIIRYVFYGLAVIQVVIIRVLRGTLLKKSPSDDAVKLKGKLFKASIFTSAFCEVPAIFGLVLFLLGGLYKDFYILLFVSLFLMFMFFPRYNNWETWLKENNPSKCFLP